MAGLSATGGRLRGPLKWRCVIHADFWQNRSVFVTGATGFLGGWLIKELRHRGARVVALIRDKSPKGMLFREGIVDHIDTVYASLGHIDELRRTIAEYEVQTIFHLAGQALVGVAKADPLGTLEANVRGTWNLLEAARQCRKPQLIVASSDKAYGSSRQLPYVETHPMQGQFPYEASKSCADLISRMYATTYNLPIAVVRCGNLFGGGDLNFSRTIPGTIHATLAQQPFVIRSDGKYVRDFLYVEDAADAYLCLAECAAQDNTLNGEAFNFSLGLRLTVLDLVEMILRMMGRPDLKPVILNMAKDEIREQYLDAEKAQTRLGWKPRCGMEEGLRRSIAWYREFFSYEESAVAVF